MNAIARRQFLQQMASGVAAGSILLGKTASAEATRYDERPNILLILTDQQNATMLSCTGNTFLFTPAMDKLAAQGIRFERAYCSNPVCTPSRFSLMTGQMPSTIGMYSNRTAHIDKIPQSITSQGLGFLFKQAGYDVAYAGKSHLPKMSVTDLGFDYIERNERDKLAATCVNFIKQNRTKPFFLVASLINPHDICYMAIRDFAETAAEKKLIESGVDECATLDQALARPQGMDDAAFFAGPCPTLPVNFEPQESEPEAIRILLERRPFRKKARQQWSKNRWREHRWAYARLTEMVDKQIALVLDALTVSGQAERTLVVFTSDHGDMDASHRMEHKSTLYNEASRIPLIIRPPGKSTSGRIDRTHLVSNGLDLLPTLCDWAGIPKPDNASGRSLRPVVENKMSNGWRTSVPIECAIGRALVTARFKYMIYDIGKHREQLFDLVADPFETRNAVNDAQHHMALNNLQAMFKHTFQQAERIRTTVLLDTAEG
jgi:arylsulfatase A-like enzyme